MASGICFLELSISILLLLALMESEATRVDQSDLLSLLTNKLHHHDRPVIIILGNNGELKKNRAVDKGSLQTSNEDGSLQLIDQFLVQNVQPKKQGIQHKVKKSTLRPYNHGEKKRERFRNQREWEQKVLQKEDRNALRSPIVKKLLRISNSLRCEAKDECQDKCASKFYGRTVTKCVIQCSTKYECDEEEDNDPCEDDNDCDDNSDNSMSTKGERLVTDKPE